MKEMSQRVLQVAVPVPLAQLFDYLPPIDAQSVDESWLGCRVLVPFGNRKLVGVVLGVEASHTDVSQLRSALARLDQHSLFGGELLQSLIWAANYYLHPMGEVLHAALPVALRREGSEPKAGERWFGLSEQGVEALENNPPRGGSRIRLLLEKLAQGECAEATLLEADPNLIKSAAELRKRGWLVETFRAPTPQAGTQSAPKLRAEQSAAVSEVAKRFGTFAPFLLDGVTGSGKTEVYLALVEQCIAKGQQALVLVPEIALTPQALRRFRNRLGSAVLAMHSGLGDSERAAAWLAAARGEVSVILGTRSAILTPLANPGLIVVDEEHDASYKQQEGWRYSARDLAVMRASNLGIPVLLGSATPSLESLHNVAAGRYHSLPLTQRAGQHAAPKIQLIDLRKQKLDEGLSAPLKQAIQACVARGEQALVFRNRRGFAPLLMCHDCGWNSHCDRCERPMTVHRAIKQLRCHHCGKVEKLIDRCPSCGTGELLQLGAGTERLEAAVEALLADVPVVRVDRDTTRSKARLDAMLNKLMQGESAVLVGTQMLAKGHDLPNLTLVAITSVDEALFSTDFRSVERLAQLLTQVAGRAGRGAQAGTVILQTHQPEHPQLRRLIADGYHAVAADELAIRQATGFPPYTHLALLSAAAKNRVAVDQFLSVASDLLVAQKTISATPPMPAPMALRAGMHRGQILLQANRRSDLHSCLQELNRNLTASPHSRKVRWHLDVDPLDLY